MVVGAKRVFVYGRFIERAAKQYLLPPPPPFPSAAVEILREFSAVELIGKVYVLTPGRNWQPASPEGARGYDWFRTYRNITQHKQTTRSRKLYFETQDSDFWEVLFLRQESDETGQYMAVALRHENLKD